MYFLHHILTLMTFFAAGFLLGGVMGNNKKCTEHMDEETADKTL